MVKCRECGRENALDSRFCRFCGEALDPAERESAETSLRELIAEGRRLLGEGRLEEARLVAERACAESPESSAAHALAGDVHEKAGRLADAIAAYERVVQIDPDSTLDQIKLQALRREFELGPARRAAIAKRRAAFAAGAAAFLFVASVAGFVAAALPAPEDERGGSSAEIVSEPFPQSPPGPVAQASPGEGAPTSAPATGAGEAGAPADPMTTPAGEANPPRRPAPPLGRLASSSLPEALPADGFRPIALEGPIGSLSVTPEQRAAPAPEPRTDPDPRPVETPRPEQTERREPGVIEIRPSAGEPVSIGGSETMRETPPPPPAARQNWLEIGRERYQLGDYAGAAQAYERAIESGASGGLVHQRLAQSLEKLGRRQEAVAAYTRAKRAFEAELARGGPSERLQAAIEACERAIRLLQGDR